MVSTLLTIEKLNKAIEIYSYRKLVNLKMVPQKSYPMYSTLFLLYYYYK